MKDPTTEKKNNNFLLHGSLLAVASLLVHLIGMLYRIPMVAIIGSEGTGYYSNAFQVYNILILLSSYSLPLAVSKIVSARVAHKKWKETRDILRVSLIFAAIVGTVFGLITFLGADFFCSVLLKSPNSSLALKCLAPTVAIVAFLGVLRGFCQGLETMIPTAISQVVEQIINAAVSIGAAAIMTGAAVRLEIYAQDPSIRASYGAAGGTIGTGVGALAALAVLIIVVWNYRPFLQKNVNADKHETTASYGSLFRVLTLTAVPVVLSTAAYNLIDIIDTACFNNAMLLRGMEEAEYASIWGDYNNAFHTLIHIPIALASAIASALVPSLSAAHARKDKKEVNAKIALTIRVTLLFAIPVSLGMMAIGGSLAKLLFSSISAQAERYLAVGGLSVLLFSMSTVTNAILHGISHMEKPVLHAFISLAVHVAFLALLLFVFKADIFAVIVCHMIFGTVMMVLNLYSIWKFTGYKIEFNKSLMLPFAISAVMVVFLFLLSLLVTRFATGNFANFLIVFFGFIIGGAGYLAGILLTGCLTREQLLELPYGKKLAAFFTKLHLLRREK